MDIQKFHKLLKRNGVLSSGDMDHVKFEPVKVNELKYLLMALLAIPALYVFFTITGPSIIGLIIMGAGISMGYNGIKTRNDIIEFNSKSLEIGEQQIKFDAENIPVQEAKSFKANLSTNPLFPNIKIDLITSDREYCVLKIWGKKSKYLNEDKYEIIKGLNAILEHNKNK